MLFVNPCESSFLGSFFLTWKLPGRQWLALVGESVGVKWQNAHSIFDRTGLKTSEKFRIPVMFLILLAEWEFDIKIKG